MSQRWIFIALFIALPAAYMLLVGRHHLQSIDELHAEIRESYGHTAAEEEQIRRKAELDGMVGQFERWHAQLEESLAPVAASPPLLLEMSGAIVRFGLYVKSAETLPPQPQLPLENERVHLALSGPFEDVYRFVQHFESSRPMGRVTSIEIVPIQGTSTVHADLTLARFWRRTS